jgi:4,5-DOPA dioxygenase extradiol
MRTPALFLGHGNPMNAVSRNGFTEGWTAIGGSISRPRAVLAVSAHWYVGETAVTAGPAPRTIHDFAEQIRFPVEGIDGGSVSMLAVQAG